MNESAGAATSVCSAYSCWEKSKKSHLTSRFGSGTGSEKSIDWRDFSTCSSRGLPSAPSLPQS